MASIRKRNGRYQAQVRIGSVSKSASFSLKAEARAWAAGEEAALYSLVKASRRYVPMDLAEVLLRYMDVISPEKAGYRDELTVIRAMLREDWTSIPIDRLGPQHLANYRDRRLKTVKPSTFNRQFGIIRHACHVSRAEWGWHFDGGFLGIRMARVKPQSSVRRVSPEQLNSLLKASEFSRNPRMRHIIELAVETGLRRGEICSLNVADVDLESGLLHVRQTKNGHPRSVPLTANASTAVAKLVALASDASLTGMKPNAIRLSFARIKRRSGETGVRFHDFRHEAISRFFEMGLTPPEVAMISGHRTMSQLTRYSHASIDRVALLVKSS